jgi:hypothetical protein
MEKWLVKIYLGIFLMTGLWKSIVQRNEIVVFFFLAAIVCLFKKPIKPLGYLLTIASAILLIVSLFGIAQQFYFGNAGLQGYFFLLACGIAGLFGMVEYFVPATAKYTEKQN